MTITYRDLFHRVAFIRRQFNIPTNICHLTHSDAISKADEAFWEYKCENNLDFPLRYSEVHRMISVSKKKQRVALINLDPKVFEEYDLVAVFLHRDLVFRGGIQKDTSIIHNFCSDESKEYVNTLSRVFKKMKKCEISNLVGTVIRDWIVEVPLHKALIIAQASKDFESKYHNNIQVILSECYSIIKEISPKHAKQFKKDVKEKYYGSAKKVFCDEKTRSQGITREP